MLDTKSYLNLKKEIKYMCRKNVIALCENMQLNDYEKDLLMHFYDGKSKVCTCMDLCIGSDTYSKHMKILFNKINDYKKTL